MVAVTKVGKTICHVLHMISVSDYSLCGIAEGCSAQLQCIPSIQGCRCGNAAILQFVTSLIANISATYGSLHQ